MPIATCRLRLMHYCAMILLNVQVDKVQFVSHIKQLPSPERRNAELALFCHQPQQAEAIYLQAGLVFRAIELNMNLFNWERYIIIFCLRSCLALPIPSSSIICCSVALCSI